VINLQRRRPAGVGDGRFLRGNAGLAKTDSRQGIKDKKRGAARKVDD